VSQERLRRKLATVASVKRARPRFRLQTYIPARNIDWADLLTLKTTTHRTASLLLQDTVHSLRLKR
jgi:hypothetical protein